MDMNGASEGVDMRRVKRESPQYNSILIVVIYRNYIISYLREERSLQLTIEIILRLEWGDAIGKVCVCCWTTTKVPLSNNVVVVARNCRVCDSVCQIYPPVCHTYPGGYPDL
jgi:hypothetical protein